MNAAILMKLRVRFKRELIVVGVTMLGICCLPVVALATMTDIHTLANDTSLKLYTANPIAGNSYALGNCTFWVSQRRAEVGFPIPQTWGNANTWDDNAYLDGYRVDHVPTLHAIMQTDEGVFGHVAFVEAVEPDGSWTISEMNVKGWDIVDDRSLSKSDASNFNFIH